MDSYETLDYDVQLCKCQHQLDVGKKILLKAVAVMEDAANNTKDVETFKTLTVGYHKIIDLLKLEEIKDEKE